MKILPFTFYNRPTQEVAQDLLGKIIIRQDCGKTFFARIVETEGYLGIHDRACHTFGGRKSARTASMYMNGGTAYVYLIYGIHYCLNVVTRDEKSPEAVLIRAAEPLGGFDHVDDERLLAGPGKLCREMKITKRQDGMALNSHSLRLMDDDFKVADSKIVACSRIGVDYALEAKDWPLRFYIKDHPGVSRQE